MPYDPREAPPGTADAAAIALEHGIAPLSTADFAPKKGAKKDAKKTAKKAPAKKAAKKKGK